MAKFRVRARTVDMLGRQQIAGIPTAISELFKNAHDAYARNAEVDYFRDDGLFVLRDDGLGMTRKDFEQRWLTLGTESKLGGKGGLAPPPRDRNQGIRPILGEKGIGRLAIAIIGPQVFILTRAKRDGRPSDLTVGAYIHWGLFQLPGLDLEDILIPVREFEGGSLPDSTIVRQMVDEVSTSLEEISGQVDSKKINYLQREMADFDINPSDIDTYLNEPSLTGEGCGTHFFIKPADPIIQHDIDTREDDRQSTRFEKHLIGFTNTMTPEAKSPPIITRFRDHRNEGAPNELIGEKAFFTPEEYREVDHHFSGRFDEFGQFRGGVGIYQGEPEDYILNWKEFDGNPTLCGPFKFSFAIMQAAPSDSLVPRDEHSKMLRKLNRHGGLYIYRDGVRVQPYGDSDYDWLNIERRRTMGAGYYYYSYRRMFGVIELSQTENRTLVEKAGREGFSENKAYRQFQSILINFFVQTAGDFFREDGKYSENWEEKKHELNRNEEIRKKKSQQVSKKRGEFERNLEKFFDLLEKSDPEAIVKETLAEVKYKTDHILKANTKPTQKAIALMRIEKEGRDVLREFRSTLAVTKPRGIGLSRKASNEWLAYSTELETIEDKILSPAETEIETFITSTAKQAKLPIDHIARIDAAVHETADNAVRTVRRLKGENEETFTGITKLVRDTTSNSLKAVNQVVDEVIADLNHLKLTSSDADILSAKREEFESKIEEVFEKERNQLERLKEQFIAMSGFWQEDGYDTVELTEALEEELVALREQSDTDLEMAQIGLALNTINHEFEKTVGALRDGFKRMQSWASTNPKLEKLYNDMRYSFEHLDGYLTLFTPLDRRLQRQAIDITGKDIFEFLIGLFEVRLKRHNVELKATQAFRESEVHGYPSSFFPIYVNLVDNAIFWQQRNNKSTRQIILDFDGHGFLVSDNGPGVSARDRENIFMLNFSRKPGGRGMGLHISRQVLSKIGYDLTLDPPTKEQGATFRISPKPNKTIE